MNTPETPLQSWKEIGAYLQRDATTARRWEKEEGLPVHRHSHKTRSSVYAYPSEVDTWRASRKVVPEAAPNTFWRVPTFALAILLCLVMVGNGIRPQAASAKSGPLAKRLVCPNCPGEESDISRDGRWMVFPHGDQNDLSIRDLVTGQVKRLMVVSGKEQESDAGPDTPLFSPDRRWILYVWYQKDHGTQLRLMEKEPRSKPRILVEIPEKTVYEPEDWFPDGKSALVHIGTPDGTMQLARVSVADGAVKVLKSLERRFRFLNRARVSPDGQYIAYSALAVNPSGSRLAATDPKDQHIYILTADGSGETEIIKTAGINEDPVWTPDGKHILFTSDRSGKVDLWSIAIQSGKAASPESLVSADLGNASGLGMAGGSYYYNSFQRGDHIHVVKVTSSGSAPETESFVGAAPTWSPNGKSLAFKRHHPGSADLYDLVIRSLETGNERLPLAAVGLTGNAPARWFHDGESLITGVTRNLGPIGPDDAATPRGYFRITLSNGDLKEIPERIAAPDAISPDHKTFYLKPLRETPIRVVALDLGTGQERVLASFANWPSNAALSPDGRTLAIGWVERPPEGAKLHIGRISVDGSGYREVFTRTDHLGGGRAVAWDGDGRSILFDQQQPGSGWGVMRVPADGGPAALVFATLHERILDFDLSPDGSRIAYSSNESASELWALDNVLSGLK